MHRSGSWGTASALPKCSIISGCGTRIVLRGQKPLALCDRCPCFGSLFPPLAVLTFAASSIIEHFGNADAVPQLPERCLSRKAGIVRCCHNTKKGNAPDSQGAFPFYFLTYPFMSLYAFHSGAKSNRYRVVAL